MFLIIQKSPVIVCLWWGPQKEESAHSRRSVLKQKDTSSSTKMELTAYWYYILFPIVLPNWYVTVGLLWLFFNLSGS